MTTNATGIRILGSLRAADGKGVVRMEDRFDTDINDMWSALTEPSRLARWLGDVDGDLRIGGEFQARFFASEWEGTGRVETCEAPQHLLVTTTDKDQGATHTIEATLSAEGDHTVLVIEEAGMPVEHLGGYGAGIQIHVEDLAAYLAGRSRVAQGRWQELMPAYEELAKRVR